jgi:diacylglycerol kinase (CTP)
VLDEGLKLCGKPLGLWLTASVLGLGGAVVEALGECGGTAHRVDVAKLTCAFPPPPLRPHSDLGFDDNLTLPILTGGVMWAWLAICSHLF